MRQINYELKARVLKEHSDLLREVNRANKLAYAERLFESSGVSSYCLEHKDEYRTHQELTNYCVENELMEEYLECFKILHSSYARTKRLKDRVRKIISEGDSVFATLTFNDETLESTSETTRRRYVAYYLKSFNAPYIANIDYGSENGREHYHAIIQVKHLRLKDWRKYGNINVKRVRIYELERDTTKLSKYVAKLTNHAIKETTKRSTLIYSR